MKKIIPVFLLCILISGCKKTLENIAQDAVIQAMINGQWAITSFTRDGADITSTFTGYKFQYYSNKTVEAIKNGTVEKTGNWDGNAVTMTTWADFPNAGLPLNLINGTWNINNNSWTFVAATQNNGVEVKTMRLDKQ